MIFRSFVQSLCAASGESFSAKAARTLLWEVTQDDNFESILSDLSDSKLRSYIRGDRNISKEFAAEIRSAYHREYLEEYLKDICYQPESMQRLCDAFRAYCPEISDSNAVDLVVGQFEQMLDSAIRGKQSIAAPEIEYALSETDRNSMKKLIINLRQAMEQIEETSIKLLVGAPESRSEYQREFDINYKEFRTWNHELHMFAVIYPELEVLQSIFSLSGILDFTAKWIRKDDGIYIEHDKQLDEYRCCLETLIKLVHDK